MQKRFTTVESTVFMAEIERLTLRADATGTLQLVCERENADAPGPEVRSFAGKNQFGLLVDELSPDERVTLFFQNSSDGYPSSD